MPDKPILVLGYVPELRQKQVLVYTKGWDVEVEDEDGDGDFNADEKRGLLFLKEGWYQECEQRADTYDYVWFNRVVTHWMLLPTKP